MNICVERVRVLNGFRTDGKITRSRYAEIYGVKPRQLSFVLSRNYNVAVMFGKQRSFSASKIETESVAETAFCNSRRRAAFFNDGSKRYVAVQNIFVYYGIKLFKVIEVGYAATVFTHR